VFTDSMELYGSRLKELRQEHGEYTETDAVRDFEMVMGQGMDTMQELSHYDRKRIHNLKYYTWIEQQKKSLEELNAQWFDYKNYWSGIHESVAEIDELIHEFNKRTGLKQ